MLARPGYRCALRTALFVVAPTSPARLLGTRQKCDTSFLAGLLRSLACQCALPADDLPNIRRGHPPIGVIVLDQKLNGGRAKPQLGELHHSSVAPGLRSSACSGPIGARDRAVALLSPLTQAENPPTAGRLAGAFLRHPPSPNLDSSNETLYGDRLYRCQCSLVVHLCPCAEIPQDHTDRRRGHLPLRAFTLEPSRDLRRVQPLIRQLGDALIPFSVPRPFLSVAHLVSARLITEPAVPPTRSSEGSSAPRLAGCLLRFPVIQVALPVVVLSALLSARVDREELSTPLALKTLPVQSQPLPEVIPTTIPTIPIAQFAGPNLLLVAATRQCAGDELRSSSWPDVARPAAEPTTWTGELIGASLALAGAPRRFPMVQIGAFLRAVLPLTLIDSRLLHTERVRAALSGACPFKRGAIDEWPASLTVGTALTWRCREFVATPFAAVLRGLLLQIELPALLIAIPVDVSSNLRLATVDVFPAITTMVPCTFQLRVSDTAEPRTELLYRAIASWECAVRAGLTDWRHAPIIEKTVNVRSWSSKDVDNADRLSYHCFKRDQRPWPYATKKGREDRDQRPSTSQKEGASWLHPPSLMLPVPRWAAL
jgi:hypothetical protein